MCYDLDSGITSLQKSISTLEAKLAKQKRKLRDVLEVEKPNRIRRLNDYLSK